MTSRRNLLKSGLMTGVFGAAAAMASAASAQTAAQPAQGAPKYDLIVAGAGVAGLVCAIRAKELGLNVLLLEKMGSPAGNTVYCAGFMLGVDSKAQKAKNVDSGTVEELYNDMIEISQGKADPVLSRVVAENCGALIDWMIDSVGVKYITGLKMNWPGVGRAHLTTGLVKPGGRQLVEYLLAKAKSIKLPIQYNTKVVALLQNPKTGAVDGVRVKTKKGVEEIRSKYGVVLTLGGFSANPMLLTMTAGVAAANMPVRGSRSLTGENITLTTPLFAKVVNVDQYHCGPIHGPTGANPLNIVNTGIAVSKETKRFTDEGQSYVDVSRDTAAKTPNNWAFMIVDENIHNLPSLKNDWVSYSSKGAPVYKADTIEELAKQAGLDPAALKKIVDEYNEALKNKTLDKLDPPNTHPEPLPVLQAPFYAVPFQGGMTTTFGGPTVNAKGQVLDMENRQIKGLFAAGNAMGGLFYNDYIAGGTLLTSAGVFGKLIAEYVKELDS